MIVCSATLHAFEVKKMAEKLMHFPTWVDLKVTMKCFNLIKCIVFYFVNGSMDSNLILMV